MCALGNRTTGNHTRGENDDAILQSTIPDHRIGPDFTILTDHRLAKQVGIRVEHGKAANLDVRVHIGRVWVDDRHTVRHQAFQNLLSDNRLSRRQVSFRVHADGLTPIVGLHGLYWSPCWQAAPMTSVR